MNTLPAARSIIHVDMDAFYASVEQRDNPSLKGRPVIVGGTRRRGVVAAASYEARVFGVRSAMPISRALSLCPDGVFLPVRMAHYQAVSRQVFDVFRQVTSEVEGLSLDEAFLDVTDCRRLFGSVEAIGTQIKNNILAATDLTASVGMAPNKFLAKVASELDKPDGFCVITDANKRDVLDPLPVATIWGVGKKAQARLHAAGITTVRELRLAPDGLLARTLGNQAMHFKALARGEDERPVVPDAVEKSVGSEDTFATDLRDPRHLYRELLRHVEIVTRRMRAKGIAGNTVTIKVREPDFTTYTRRHSFAPASNDTDSIYAQARTLLENWLGERPGAAVRLLGVTVSNLLAAPEQISMFSDPAQERHQRLASVTDSIRNRFGPGAVTRATLVDKNDTD